MGEGDTLGARRRERMKEICMKWALSKGWQEQRESDIERNRKRLSERKRKREKKSERAKESESERR